MVLATHTSTVNEEIVIGSRRVPAPPRDRRVSVWEYERDVVCLGCSRCLARVAPDGDRWRVRPPRGEARPLLVETPRGARCQRCGGYPFIGEE